MKRVRPSEGGFTVVELTISLVVFTLISISLVGMFSTLVSSAVIAKRKAVASTIATNQMEYLKSLPYDSLAIAGGPIYSTSPLPATVTKTVNGVVYTATTSINYADDAYDGCANYPTTALKMIYCRSYPPPSGAPAVDPNPADYKVVHVNISTGGAKLAEVDTQISARVSETASTTGALFVKIIDNNGNPISGATASVVNNTVSPAVNVSDSTDANGTAIFYGLPPDTNNYDYAITGSKTGYSTLTTIVPTALQPTYPNQKIITQTSSYVTLTIKQQGIYSLLVEATNTSSTPLASLKVNTKGGYTKYTATTDTAYYYDTISPSDIRPVTDASGLTSFSNLVPGGYIFCGDLGATSCVIGGTTYYLAAALSYSGSPYSPVNVPTYDPTAPPAVTYPYGGNNFLQKVRLIFSTSSSHPRIASLSPYEADRSVGLTSVAFNITGVNLPCSSVPASCSTTVRFLQGSNTYTASCTGTTGTQLNCTVNLTGAADGNTQLVVIANGFAFTTPVTPTGGMNVVP